MHIDGMGGINPQDPKLNNQQNKQVSEYMNSVWKDFDTDGSGNLEKVNSKQQDEISPFKAAIRNFIAKLTGTEEISGTDAVNGATNEVSTPDNSYNFDNDGNVISDVKTNNDGSKTITAGNERLEVSKEGNSFSVFAEDGTTVSISQTPDGGFEFKDEDGKIHRFDANMNPV